MAQVHELTQLLSPNKLLIGCEMVDPFTYDEASVLGKTIQIGSTQGMVGAHDLPQSHLAAAT